MADATMRITTRRLDGQRRLVSDIVRLSNRVPIFPVDRIMALSELEAVRREALPRIGWSAVFMKAYAIVARDRPALRSWYVPWRILTPWRRPRWATSPVSVASLAISRPRDPNGPHADPADVALDGDVSPYGTRGQNGNVWEWQESAFDGTNDTSAEGRSLRGGSWSGVGEPDLRSSYHFNSSPNTSANNIGFRIASVPEPSTAVLIASACAVLVTWRRRTCVPWRM